MYNAVEFRAHAAVVACLSMIENDEVLTSDYPGPACSPHSAPSIARNLDEWLAREVVVAILQTDWFLGPFRQSKAEVKQNSRLSSNHWL